MQTISVRESIGFGWNTFKSRPWIFIGVGLAILAVSMVINGVESSLVKGAEYAFGPQAVAAGIIALIVGVGSVVASTLLDLGRTVFFLRAHDDVQGATVRTLWHPQYLWPYLLVSVLYGIAVLVGLVLLIVPGIIIGITFGFASYLVAEKGIKPIEAFKESARLTKGNRWNLLWLGFALLGINILGTLALVIGLFVSLPVSVLAMVHVYRTLSGNAPAVVSADTVEDEVVVVT